jgi:hypothetical protein
MSANVTGKKQCVTCSKSGGIMICDGCQQSFCGKHSVEHRQQLTNQLDGIMQEHDLLQQELDRSSDEHILLQKINQWEKESITKIQIAAEVARTDLRQILDRSKEQISKACHDIAVNLRSSREDDDFSENDLTRWVEQLKELKLEFHSPSSIDLIENEQSPIPLISIQQSSFTNKNPAKDKQTSVLENLAQSAPLERFMRVFDDGIIEEEGTVAKHIGCDWEYVHILGEQLYSQGRHLVRFKVEYKEDFYYSFLGCVSSQTINDKISFHSLASAGWFGWNEIYHHMEVSDEGYDSSAIRTDDVLNLTFDCEKQQIELYHERKNKTYKIQIDTTKAPFPWQLLVVLCRSNNCIRILPNE